MAIKDEGTIERLWRSFVDNSFSFVGDQVMKGSKTAKNLDSSYNANPSLAAHNEAKSKGIFRKRKDRSHSISGKDKKVVRSNSEERIIKKNICNSIRRVSSHEDFQKVPNADDNVEDLKENANASARCESNNHSNNDEVEWKRSGERLFRLPLYRRKHNYLRRSPKLRPVITSQYEEKSFSLNNNEEDDCLKLKQINMKNENAHQSENLYEKKECSSPYESPTSSVLDLTTLHKQIDCLEPIPSSTNRHVSEFTETLPSTSVACNKLLSSPRNSIITTERIYLNQYVAQSKSSPLKSALNPVEKRLNYLSKQIKRIKKKIRQYEQDFEKKRGYKPSEMDKLSDCYANTLVLDLYKLKKEYKQTKKQEKVPLPLNFSTGQEEFENQASAPATLAETLSEIEQRLISKRHLADRTTTIDDMTNTQLLEEKIDIQKGLLYLQTKHGRPSSKEDKDLVRPLYDRYRNVKRIIARSVMPSSNVIELATIHEHETLTIAPSTESPPSTPLTESLPEPTKVIGEETISIEKGLHALSLDELVEEKRCTVEEKKRLQKSLKEFENNFLIKVGRKIQKDDREPMNHVYDSFKKAKSKLKLIDALLKKRNCHFYM